MKDSGDGIVDRLLPRQIDNSCRGHKVALWLFGDVVFMKTSIGLGTIFNGRNAATSADGIPLDTFTTAGAQAFLAVFAAWGSPRRQSASSASWCWFAIGRWCRSCLRCCCWNIFAAG